MQTGHESGIGSVDGILRVFFECVRNSLPVVAVEVMRGGELLGAAGKAPDPPTGRAQPEPYPADVLACPVPGPNGTIEAVIRLGRPATASDRTIAQGLCTMLAHCLDQHANAAQAARSRAYLGDALEALPEALAIFDEEERFVFWNTKFVEFYGQGIDICASRTFEDHLRACLKAGVVRDAVGREDEWLSQRLERFRMAHGAHEHALASGRWVRTQDRPLPHGGRIGIRTDITDYIEREQSFRLLFAANPSPMLIIDRENLAIMAVNEASVAFYGYGEQDMLRMSLPQIRPEKVEGEIQAMIDQLETPEIARKPRIHVCADGSQRIVRVNTRFIEYKGRACILAAVFDMTERFRAEEEILRTRRFLREVVDHVPVALFVKDMDESGRYVLFNRAAESLFGTPQAEVVGSMDERLLGSELFAEYQRQDTQVLRQGMLDLIEEKPGRDGTRSIRLRKVALDDSTTGRPRYVLGLAEDVTEQRTREAEISRLALQDSLTGLANRRLFFERLDAGISALQSGQLQAVLFLDLDGFKAVNDTHGHPAGDRLLQIVAERLQAIVRPQDTVARLGGDEFAVTAAVSARQDAELLAARIIAALEVPYPHDADVLRVSASVGISLAASRTCAPQTLVSEADVALYDAKRNGKNRYSLWSRSLEPAEASERLVFRGRPAGPNLN